jgi:hypothetical protein
MKRLGLVCGAAILAGCGNVTAPANGDGGADAAALTAQQGCHQEAQAICDAIDACASFWLQIVYGDKPTCVSRLSLSCMDDQTVTGTTRTVADLVACAQAVGSASCPDLLASRFPEVCQVKPGMRMNGVACGSDWQCQSTYCSKQGDCGVCGPRMAAGGNCTADDGCQTGMICASSRCAVPGDVGATCAPDSQPCRSGLYCTSAHTCAARVGAGGSCADTDQACDIAQGVACNPISHTCDPVRVAKGGETCGIVNRVLTLCVGLNPCTGATLTQTGICANPAGDGEACGNANSGRNCVAPATCAMQVCRLPSATTCQ